MVWCIVGNGYSLAHPIYQIASSIFVFQIETAPLIYQPVFASDLKNHFVNACPRGYQIQSPISWRVR